MNSYLRLLPIIVLAFLCAFLSPGVFAQTLNDNNYANPRLYIQDGANNLTAQIGTTTSTSSFSVDWSLLIPVLVIAVGLFALRGSRERVDRNYYHPGRDYTIAYHDIAGERKRKKKQIHRLKNPLKSA